MNLHTLDEIFTHSHKPFFSSPLYRQSYISLPHLHWGPVHLNFFLSSETKKKKRDGEKEIATTASTRTVGQTLRHTRVSAVKIKTQHRRLQGHGQISPDSICQIQNIFDCQNSGWSCFSIETLVNAAKLGIAKRCSPISLHTRRPISWLPPHQKLKKLRISNITISTNSFPLAL